ncbi:spermatogenesis-associated protein 24-like [Conger conger]|uniref:spermatogenesis-associated protein 24-like n=1 Tax=Conger conger TaxID=82655 RepID=UPI002A5AF307|nr:spermatogenesis-associated protein 24-like [Conger conger]
MQTESFNTSGVVFKQLQEVIRIQQQIILSLNEKEERHQHDWTRQRLSQESEKLNFATGEIQILTRKLEREKESFEKALHSEKTKARKELAKSNKLNTKCARINSIIQKREDILNEKENQISELHTKLEKQRVTLKTRLTDLEVQRQQKEYLARVLQRSGRTGPEPDAVATLPSPGGKASKGSGFATGESGQLCI